MKKKYYPRSFSSGLNVKILDDKDLSGIKNLKITHVIKFSSDSMRNNAIPKFMINEIYSKLREYGGLWFKYIFFSDIQPMPIESITKITYDVSSRDEPCCIYDTNISYSILGYFNTTSRCYNAIDGDKVVFTKRDEGRRYLTFGLKEGAKSKKITKINFFTPRPGEFRLPI